MGARRRDSCREFFKILGRLPLMAQYTYSITMCSLSGIMSTSWKILNYMMLKPENIRTYFSRNQVYLLKGSSL